MFVQLFLISISIKNIRQNSNFHSMDNNFLKHALLLNVYRSKHIIYLYMYDTSHLIKIFIDSEAGTISAHFSFSLIPFSAKYPTFAFYLILAESLSDLLLSSFVQHQSFCKMFTVTRGKNQLLIICWHLKNIF